MNNTEILGPQKLSYIPEDELKKYATLHKCSMLDAYRDMFSQKLLDMLSGAVNARDICAVVKELVHQIVGTGTKSPIVASKELPPTAGA